jgi:hypothetical protein
VARGAEREERKGKVGNPRGGERRAGAGAARERERHSEAERMVRAGNWEFGELGVLGGWAFGGRGLADDSAPDLTVRFLGRLGFRFG